MRRSLLVVAAVFVGVLGVTGPAAADPGTSGTDNVATHGSVVGPDNTATHGSVVSPDNTATQGSFAGSGDTDNVATEGS